MTGVDTATIVSLIMGFGALCAIAVFWMRMGATELNANNAVKSSHDAHQRIDALAAAMATSNDLAAAEKRFTDAVGGLSTDIRGLTSRVDSLLAELVRRS